LGPRSDLVTLTVEPTRASPADAPRYEPTIYDAFRRH